MDIKTFYKNYFNIDTAFNHQEELWDCLINNQFPLLLKAPTGSGKTEAIVGPFLNQFLENEFYIAPRLIYVLPMRVLVNSIAKRIKGYTENISPKISVEVQHGDIPNSPFFIADIVVTTLDQFLYGFARTSSQVGKHLDIPAGSIASSIIVFDEAHMYRDSFTFSIMRALMEILYQSNIPFVLMTATMPKILEESLFENIKIPEENKIKSDEFDLDNSVLISLEEEPIYSNGDVNISKELIKEIKNKKTLIVVNQVKRAQKIYERIRDEIELQENEIVLLHSRFTLKDRKTHEETAINIMNKTIKEPRIVVSTQVLEVGMNFSAELLLTELAPADALVQRAGRCARYKEENGEMIIFPVENEKGYLPYKKEHLEITLEWLQNNINFNIKDFNQVCNFVDILDYKASDYEARDTLIDLYECILYADTIPSNIQLRDGKSVTLAVVDFSAGLGKKEEKIRDAIRKTALKENLRENFINIDIGVARELLKKDIIKNELIFDRNKSEWNFRETKSISPFKMYILEKNNYDKNLGIKNDETIFV